MKKWSLTILSVIVFLALLVCFILFTQPGLRFLVFLSQRALHKHQIYLQPKDVHGTLHHFRLDHIRFDLSGLTLTFDQVDARWHLNAAFEGKLDIAHINAQQLSIASSSAKPSPHTVATAMPAKTYSESRPWIYLHQLHINQVVWLNAQGKVDRTLGQLNAEVYSSAQQLYFQSIVQHGDHDQALLNGQIEYDMPYQFQVAVKAHANVGYNQFSAEGTLSGMMNQYQLNAHLNWQKNQYHYVDLTIAGQGNPQQLTLQKISGTLNNGSINGQGSFSWAEGWLWQFDLAGKNIKTQWQDPKLPTLQFALHTVKTAQNEEVSLNANSGSWNMQLEQIGQKDTQGWSNFLHTLTFGSGANNTWAIPHIVPLTLQPSHVAIPNTCLQHLNESLCFVANWQPDQWMVQLHSTSLTLNNIPSLFNGLRVYGNAKIDVEATQPQDQPLSAHAVIDIQHFKLQPPMQFSLYNAMSNQLQIATGQLTADITQGVLHSHALLNFSPNNHIEGDMTLSHMDGLWPSKTSWMNSQLHVSLQNVGILNDLMPQLADLKGQLVGNLTVDSLFSNPLYLGELKLSNASADLPTLGIQLTQGNIDLKSTQQGLFDLTGAVHSGQGKLTFQGAWDTTGERDKFWVQMHGAQFTLIDLPQLMMITSPTLTYTRTPELQTLMGDINIDQANINADLIQKQSQASDDVVMVNNENEVIHASPAIPFSSTLTLKASKGITFQGFGINTQVTGQITLIIKPQQAMVANGTLNLVNGQYLAYGKQFYITSGSLIFNNSPFDNPTLNIVAQYQLSPQAQSQGTELSRLEVGVDVYGTLSRPQLRLFSNPSMSQEDILSYIVLGVPLSQAQPTNGSSSLSSAALSFALNGGSNTVFNNIQHSLGLNQLSIGTLDDRYGLSSANSDNTTNDSASQDNTALFVGKSLGPNFSVSYGVGFFNSQQEVRTRYQISRRWQLQTDTSNVGSGADLIYTIDR